MNPAASVGLVVGKSFPARELPAYVAAQLVGGIAGTGVLSIIASGATGWSTAGGFCRDGHGHVNGHARATIEGHSL